MLLKKQLLFYISLIGITIFVISLNVWKTISDTVDLEVRSITLKELEYAQKNINRIIEKTVSLTLGICIDYRAQAALRQAKKEGSGVRHNEDSVKEFYKNIISLGYNNPEILSLGAEMSQPRRAWISRSIENPDEVVFTPLFNENNHIVRVTKCIYDVEDRGLPLGILIFDLDILEFSSIIIGPRTDLFLIDGNEALIYPYSDHLGVLPHWKKADEWKGEKFKTGERTYIVFSRPIYMVDWHILLAVPENDLMRKGVEIQKNFWSVAVFAITASILIAVYFSYSISRPIIRLADHMKSIESGERPHTIEYGKSKGEIRVLYESFNFMLKRMSELIQEVYISKINAKEAELKALQAQINPHFVYNTLDSINWMAATYKARDIQSMVHALATMLRYSLNNGENLIPVRNEIEQVRSYIEIQKFRYPDNFNVLFEISENILDFRIIKLVLQPLVENAIIHGFDNRNEKGTIILKGRRMNGDIVFEVMNDGNPIDLAKVASVMRPDGNDKPVSYGIRNVNDRLIKQYGEDYAIRFHMQGRFTIATIRIPMPLD